MDSEQASDSAMTALRDAITCIGSQSATGKLLGVTQGAVSKWMLKRQPLPAEHVLTIERRTGISRHRLRPDLYPVDDVAHPAVIGGAASSGSCDRRADSHGSAIGEPVR